VIRHAIAEGLLLLRQRGVVSVVLAFALAVPISLAGIGFSLYRWLSPMASLSSQSSTVAVLLHPRLDHDQRRQWIVEEAAAHPEWQISEISKDDLTHRLQRWFPYLDELIADGDASLPPLIEIATEEPQTVAILEDRPEVLAVGPHSSIQQSIARVADRLAWSMTALSSILLAGAVLLAAVWVHVELYRHADEITIMRLVGATEGSIRGPFVVAVAIPGVAAGLLSVVGTRMTTAGLSQLSTALGLVPVETPEGIVALQLATGLLLPVGAAVFTLVRHAALDIDG
jgi:cell division transport system permease protein